MGDVDFLAGFTVHQIAVGYDLRLVASANAERVDANHIEVVMEGPCFVTGADGSEHRIELSDPKTIPLLLALQGRIITEASAEEGTLRAVVDNGGALRVPPDAKYEAWRIEGPGDAGVVCMPGGETVSWEA